MAVPTQEDFIEAVLDQLATTQTKLGKALGADNAYATVHNWKTGKVRLTYAETMRMLEMCGWLAMGNGAKVARIEPPDGRPESIVEMVKETLANTNKLLEAVGPQRKAAPRRPKQKQSG